MVQIVAIKYIPDPSPTCAHIHTLFSYLPGDRILHKKHCHTDRLLESCVFLLVTENGRKPTCSQLNRN